MKVLTGWPVPVFMMLVFAALISTSDASNAGILAACFGLLLVLLFWGMFREFSVHAEISRALSVGDGATAARLTAVQLKKRSARRRGPFAIYRAMAHELTGNWREIEDDLAATRPEHLRGSGGGSSWQLVADCLRIGARCELGEVAQARALFDEAVAPRVHAQGGTGGIFSQLTEGRLRFAEGDHAAAQERLLPLTRNIRLGPAQRAIAFHYLARCAAAQGKTAEAEKLRSQAAALAPTSWFAEPLPAIAASAPAGAATLSS
jgi:predicted Zn-dependent protease